MLDTWKPGDHIDEHYGDMFNNQQAAQSLDSMEDEAAAEQADYDKQFEEIAQRNKGFDKQADKNAQLAELERKESRSIPYTQNNKTKNSMLVAGAFRKYGPAGGIIGVLIGGFGLLAGFLSPATVLMNVLENSTKTNDSSSVAMERRFYKVFGKMTQPTDPACATSKKLKCKMGKISNSALRNLEKKGVKPIFEKGVENTTGKRGYPSKNPTHYAFEMRDGSTKNIAAKDVVGFLKNNPKAAAKVLGRSGAFSMLLRAWYGKYIAAKFYKVFKISRNGGLADGKSRTGTVQEKLKATKEKLKSSRPSMESLTSNGDLRTRIQEKVSTHLGKIKKAGSAYTYAVASCITAKAPSYIAAGVAGAQLMQLLPLYMNVIASPADKSRASAVGSGFSADDMDTVGSLITEQTPREGDGKYTSALDSQILLAAMGINKAKPKVPKDIAPGFSVLTNPLVRGGNAVDKATESECNLIMSPSAMYSFMAVDSAATLATSATIVGGIVKVLAGLAIVEVVTKVVENLIRLGAEKAISVLASNDTIPNAKGEKLGDALGVSSQAFYAAGGMAHGLPVLKQSQLAAYEKVKQENELSKQAMDVATLSPFDLSSRHTFFGSLAFSAQTAAIASGGSSLFSSISNLIGSAATTLVPHTYATNGLTSEYCGYASDYYLDTTSPKDTPGITLSGLPCTGITPEQANMDTEKAVKHMEDEGWINNEVDVNDEATLDDLVASGVIKADTPLTDFMTECGNAEAGDYIYNAASCTIDSQSKNPGSVDLGPNKCVQDENKRNCSANTADYGTPSDLKDAASLAARTPFLVDYQVMQGVNGEDDEPDTAMSSGNLGTFTAASYNMCQEENHSCPSESTKVEKITSMIRGGAGFNTTPMELVLAQELSQKTQRSLMSSLGTYESYPAVVAKNNGKAVLWNTTKFSKVDAGLLTGVNGNGSSDSTENNSFPWVHLMAGSQSVYALSVHSPNDTYGSPNDRYENAQKILAWSKERIAEGSFVVVGGDFNNGDSRDGSHEGAYCYLTKDNTLKHGKDLAESPQSNQPCPSGRVPIDQIYASTNLVNLTASDWGHVSDKYNKTVGTDHGPSYVTYHTPNVEANEGQTPGGSLIGDDFGAACDSNNALGVPCNGQCVSFVKYRLLKYRSKYHGGALGNGKDVVGNLSKLGYQTGSTARPGSVFSTSQTSHRELGHTGIVSKVNPDGSIEIEEYNFNKPLHYGTRTMTEAEYKNKGYSFAYIEEFPK